MLHMDKTVKAPGAKVSSTHARDATNRYHNSQAINQLNRQLVPIISFLLRAVYRPKRNTTRSKTNTARGAQAVFPLARAVYREEVHGSGN
jgi:hypothetical protein